MRLPYTKLSPGGLAALSSVGTYLKTDTALDPVLLEFVYLRASLLNGCAFCIGRHRSELRKHHEPDSRMDGLADWRSSDAFTPRERAALAWTDAITNVQQSHASDADYAAVNEFFREKDLVDLTLAISSINAWNRMSIAFDIEWKPRRDTTGASTA